MKFLFSSFLIIICLVFCFAQDKTTARKKPLSKAAKESKINNDLPSLYIKIESDSWVASDGTKESYEITWFRIYNNFKDSISFCVYDTSVSSTGKIGVHYEVENAPDSSDLSTRNNEGMPVGFPRYDFCNRLNLKKGETFLFGIPKTHLVKDSRIKVQFFYSWENELITNEPEHYIFYYYPYFRTEK